MYNIVMIVGLVLLVHYYREQLQPANKKCPTKLFSSLAGALLFIPSRFFFVF